MKFFAREVIEVVVWRVRAGGVIILAEVANPCRLCIRMILTGNMIGHEVYDDLQTCFVRPLNQQFKFVDALCRVFCKVGVNVVVVANGVGTARFAFNNIGIVLGDAVGRIIRLAGVFNDACKPDMRTAKTSDLFQSLGCKVLHCSAAVLLLCAERNAVCFIGTEKPRKDLVESQCYLLFDDLLFTIYFMIYLFGYLQ